jgi:hypothetical protein
VHETLPLFKCTGERGVKVPKFKVNQNHPSSRETGGEGSESLGGRASDKLWGENTISCRSRKEKVILAVGVGKDMCKDPRASEEESFRGKAREECVKLTRLRRSRSRSCPLITKRHVVSDSTSERKKVSLGENSRKLESQSHPSHPLEKDVVEYLLAQRLSTLKVLWRGGSKLTKASEPEVTMGR